MSSSSPELVTEPHRPYKIGATLTARRHNPGPPRGYSYPLEHANPADAWYELSLVEHCLKNDRMPTFENDHASNSEKKPELPQVIEITITDLISKADRHGAQVVAIRGQKIAKIFDPLYYPYPRSPKDPKDRANPIAIADEQWSREAASYRELKHFQGSLIPFYHGSWALEVPSERGVSTRTVRMILLERVRGVCLDSLDPESFGLEDDETTAIMIKTIKTELDINWKGGVRHEDLAPRNFICRELVVPKDFNKDSVLDRENLRTQILNPKLQIAIFDFGEAIVISQSDLSKLKSDRKEAKLPVSPRARWYRLKGFIWPGWLPKTERKSSQWFKEHFGDRSMYSFDN